MDKQTAAEQIRELLAELNGADVVIDDGSDSEDAEQNAAFSASIGVLQNIRHRAAMIDVDEIGKKRQDELWDRCRSSYYNNNAPEDVAAHVHKYLTALLEEIEQQG